MNHDGLFDIKVYVAEVIKKQSVGDTYKRNKDINYPRGKRNSKITGADMLFAIDVQYTLNGRIEKIENVKPYHSSIKQIPVAGENVIIFDSINHESTVDESYPQWYYMYPIAISSNVNSNIVPTVAESAELDDKFQQRNVSPLQPYRGDVLFEGRYGNSIRFSSTIDFANDYTVPGTWQGGQPGDPITIISNGKPYKQDKEFVTESAREDASSLYLTSTQNLNSLSLSKSLTRYTSFEGSQFIGVADRVIIQSKKETVILDAKEAVILNTPGDVLIGGDDAAVPIPQGDILIEILTSLITAVSKGVLVSGPQGTSLGLDDLISATNKLATLNSLKYKIKGN